MRAAIGFRVRVAGVTFAAILVATIAPGSWVALATDASPAPGGSPADSIPVSETIHRWPGARAENNPAGLYAWDAYPGSRRWMHKVPRSSSSSPDSVELTFYAAAATDEPETLTSSAVSRSWWEDGPTGRPAQVLDVREEVWLLDIGGMRVAILLASFPGTEPALLAEARAVIESIVVEPTESGHRLVFRLLEGWDSG